MSCGLMLESIWLERHRYEDAEARYQESLVQTSTAPQQTTASSCSTISKGSSPLVQGIAQARSQIQQTLARAPSGGQSSDLQKRVVTLEQENAQLKKVTEQLQAQLQRLEARVSKLDHGGSGESVAAPKPQVKPAEEEDDSDSDVDLFASGSEDEEEDDAVRKERLAAYAAKKAKKPGPIAKSNILLDVKPWDDETDMAELEKRVRSIVTDGLLWGASKLVPVAFGVKKLQISCVVEDEKVGTDFLEESITEFEDYVQSVDVVAFNKV